MAPTAVRLRLRSCSCSCSSTVFRAELPFHPARLWTFVTEELDSGALDGENLPPADPFPAWETNGIDDTCEHEHPELLAGP